MPNVALWNAPIVYENKVLASTNKNPGVNIQGLLGSRQTMLLAHPQAKSVKFDMYSMSRETGGAVKKGA